MLVLVTFGTSPGSQWWCGGQQANYHIHPPFNYPSLFTQPDCKNKQIKFIVCHYHSFTMFSSSKTLLEEVLYPNILQNPSNPWLSVPPSPPCRWLCRKVVLTLRPREEPPRPPTEQTLFSRHFQSAWNTDPYSSIQKIVESKEIPS